MTFKYKTPNKRPAPHVIKPRIAAEAEQLSGQVKGIDAAQGEERFARALNGVVNNYYFRINPTGVPTGMPGWLELDFLVQTRNFAWRAFEIDGMEFVHRGARKAAEALVKDLRRREGLAGMGIVVQEIEHVDEGKLQTLDDAKRTVRELQL